MQEKFDKDYTIKSDSPPHVPTLEVTTKIGCKVNCKYCPQQMLVKKYRERSNEFDLSIENFKKCIDKLPKNVIICFAGFSEPFLSPFAVEMINYASNSRHEVSLFTTLVGLTSEMFEEIRHVPFRKVVVHLPDVNNYSNIPVTKEYLDLLITIIKAKKPDGRVFVDKMTCQSPPQKSVFELVRNKFHISWRMTNRAGNLPYSELVSNDNIIGDLRCRLSDYNHNVLLPNGDMVLCSMDFGLKHTLGNLLRMDYLDIMKSSVMMRIQSKERASTSNLLCHNCSEAVLI